MITYITPNRHDLESNYMSSFTDSSISTSGENLSYVEFNNKNSYYNSSSFFSTLKINDLPIDTQLSIGFWIYCNNGGEFYLTTNDLIVLKGNKTANGDQILYKVENGSNSLLENYLGNGWNFILYRNSSLFTYNSTSGEYKTISHSLSEITNTDLSIEFKNSYLSDIFVTENYPSNEILYDYVKTVLKVYNNKNIWVKEIDCYNYNNSLKLSKSGRLTTLSVNEFLDLRGDGNIHVEVEEISVDKYSGYSLEESIKLNFSKNEMFCVSYGGNHYTFYGEKDGVTRDIEYSTNMRVSNLSSSGLEQYLLLNGSITREDRINYFENNGFSGIKNATGPTTIIAVTNTELLEDIKITKTQEIKDDILTDGFALMCNKISFIPEEI